MALSAPRFWYRSAGMSAAMLRPLGAIYAAGTARALRQGARVAPGVPVICVGNLTAGGTGKTPVVMALAQQFGTGVHIISRGYGGKLEGPVRVDPSQHSAGDVGDEPLLLSGFAPVWVARDRAAGARAAVAEGAKCLILDDGFQNAGLRYDLSILVVDAVRGFGNGHVIPAGPLREPVATGLARADLVISIGPGAAQAHFEKTWGGTLSLPRLRATLDPLPTGIDLRGQPVVAFAGIGDPDRFFATLEGLGAQITRKLPLGDHQALARPLMQRIEAEAKATGALIVTTEKDAVRLPMDFRQKVVTLPVRLSFEDPRALETALAPISF